MDNQHKKIKDYRELSQEETDLINEIKEQGEKCKGLIQKLHELNSVDHRWVAIGQTDLQTGIMALVRSVAQPTTF